MITKCKENEFVTRDKSSVKLEFPTFFEEFISHTRNVPRAHHK